MVPGAIILAMPTPGFHSLGLGLVRRVVPCVMSAQSGLVR
jgi:phosphoribosylaminoimidazole (AIR) synthetase